MGDLGHPKVAAIMLTRDRPQYARRALECFRRQTYVNKCLLVLDTGEGALLDTDEMNNEATLCGPTSRNLSVGLLRNEANESAVQLYQPDILCHWDDDDWSHPERMAEQVALLVSNRADCVGYRECLFWREPSFKSYYSTHPDDCECGTCGPGKRDVLVGEHGPGEAWLYGVPFPWPTGSSMMYWASVWRQKPFEDLPAPKNPEGEDVKWRRGLKCAAVSALADEPRQICRIHSSNTTNYSDLLVVKYRDTWKRVPEWDMFCRETLG